MRWKNLLFHTTGHPINTVLSYTNWKNWRRDMTDFRDANDSFFPSFLQYQWSFLAHSCLWLALWYPEHLLAYTSCYGQGSGSAVSQSCKLGWTIWSLSKSSWLFSLPCRSHQWLGRDLGIKTWGTNPWRNRLKKTLGVLVDILPERTMTNHIKDAGQFVKQYWGKFQSRQFQSALFLP